MTGGSHCDSCHFTKIGTLATQPVTLHDKFLAIAFNLMTHFPAITHSKCYNRLRFPPIF